MTDYTVAAEVLNVNAEVTQEEPRTRRKRRPGSTAHLEEEGGALAPISSDPGTAIIGLEKARELLLSQCENLAQTQQVYDFAKAAEAYAKAIKMGQEVEILARGLQLRAERKIGEFLLEAPKNPGVQGRFAGGTQRVPPVEIPTLKELGFSKNFSVMAQRLAQLPEEEFIQFERGLRDAAELRKMLKAPKLERRTNDFYPTEHALTKAFFELIPDIYPVGTVLEPCSGTGAIADMFAPRVVTNDINPDFNCDFALDAGLRHNWQDFVNAIDGDDKYDWIVTNPPYNNAVPILENAWDFCNEGLIALMRLSFAEPAGNRGDWLIEMSDHLRYFVPVNPRPKFRDDTKRTDSMTVAWMVWKKDWSWKEDELDRPFKFLTNWRSP